MDQMTFSETIHNTLCTNVFSVLPSQPRKCKLGRKTSSKLHTKVEFPISSHSQCVNIGGSLILFPNSQPTLIIPFVNILLVPLSLQTILTWKFRHERTYHRIGSPHFSGR